MVGELAVAARSDPQQPDEGAPHQIDVGESGGPSHSLEAVLGTFELTRRRLHARLKNVLRRRRVHLSSEYTLEVPHTHRHPVGKVFY